MTIPTTPGTLDRARTPIAGIARRLAVTGALALTVFGLSVPPASAGLDQLIDVKGGSALFIDEGEIVIATDEVRDGRGVRAYVQTPHTSGPVYAVDDRGAGDHDERANLSLPEGTYVLLQLCYINRRGDDVKCSAWQDAKA